MTKQDRKFGIWKWWTSHWNIIWTYYCWFLLLKINYYCIAWNNREFWWLPPLPLILNASPLANFLKQFASHSWPERGTVTLKEHKPWVGLRFTTVYAQSSILTHLALGPQHFCKGHYIIITSHTYYILHITYYITYLEMIFLLTNKCFIHKRVIETFVSIYSKLRWRTE